MLIWRLDGEKRRRERVNLSTEGWIEVKENMILPRGLISTPFRGVQYAFAPHFSIEFDNIVTVVLTMCELTKTNPFDQVKNGRSQTL